MINPHDRHHTLAIVMFVLAILTTSVLAIVSAGPPEFDLSWHTIDGGGATFSTGGGFELGGTIGQFDAGAPMTGGGFQLTGGFWAAAGSGGIVTPCPPDIAPAGGNGLVDVDDLLAIIGAWGPCPN